MTGRTGDRGRWIGMTAAIVGALVALASVPEAAIAVDKTKLAQSLQDRNQRDARETPDARDRDRDPQTRERGRSSRLLLPGPRPRDGWTLGIRGSNLRVGVRVDDVVPGTAAWRAGLERRDIVTTVNGFQVGVVGREVYELGRELNLQADRRGWVDLLVWDHRGGELFPMEVRLDRVGDRPGDRPRPVPRPREGLQGLATFSQRISPRENAVLVVRLIDVSRPLAGLQPVAETRVPYEGSVPIRFALDVEPEDLEPSRRYALQAYLLVDGRRVLENDPRGAPITRTTPGPVSLSLEPVRFDRRGPSR